jgi:hypothetical protein
LIFALPKRPAWMAKKDFYVALSAPEKQETGALFCL